MQEVPHVLTFQAELRASMAVRRIDRSTTRWCASYLLPARLDPTKRRSSSSIPVPATGRVLAE